MYIFLFFLFSFSKALIGGWKEDFPGPSILVTSHLPTPTMGPHSDCKVSLPPGAKEQ